MSHMRRVAVCRGAVSSLQATAIGVMGLAFCLPGEAILCPDGVCEGGETCCSCDEDCGPCVCGDGTCNDPCENEGNCPEDCEGVCEKTVRVEIMTDDYPGETTWELVEIATGEIVDSGGPLDEPNTLHIWDVFITNTGCYNFPIFDAFGDGICCGFGEGWYNVYHEEELQCSGGVFDDSETCELIGGGCIGTCCVKEADTCPCAAGMDEATCQAQGGHWLGLGISCASGPTGDPCDCNANGECDADELEAGGEDCNDNGIPDDCDQDCDGDGTIDDCEEDAEDCNGNGKPDNCDVADETSEDCNQDGIPDDCQLNPREAVITCSADKEIVVGSVSCFGDENQFARCFDATFFPADTTVLRLDFGIQNANKFDPIEVIGTLYSIPASFCGALVMPDAELTVLGSGSITLAADGSENFTIQTMSFGAGIAVPAGTNVVAEIAFSWALKLWPGSNPNGQTCPSYISTNRCEFPDLRDLASVGFPNMHLVLNLIVDSSLGNDENGDGIPDDCNCLGDDDCDPTHFGCCLDKAGEPCTAPDGLGCVCTKTEDCVAAGPCKDDLSLCDSAIECLNGACDWENPAADQKGCVWTDQGPGTPCDDGDDCTHDDQCSGAPDNDCVGEYQEQHFADICLAYCPTSCPQPDLDDILCVLDDFANGPAVDGCSCNGFRKTTDLHPCPEAGGGDGALGLDDILNMLDAFAGLNPCADQCPG